MSFRENLWRADLSQIELRPPLSVDSGASIRQAVELMRAGARGCVLVCENGALRGIFTERDYIKRVLVPRADLEQPICNVMSAPPVTVHGKDSVGSAIRIMYRGGYRRLPVVGDSGEATGVLSVKRLICHLVDHLGSAVYNLPPQPTPLQQAREGA